MKLNVLIVGGDSFIASKFIEENTDVYNLKVISRKNTGFNSEIVLDDLFRIGDSIFDDIDVIVNFAAIVHRPDLKDDTLYEKVNTVLPIELASKAKSSGVKHFIQLSTIAVYKQLEVISEKSKEVPNGIYGLTKLKADTELLKMQNDSFKIAVVRSPMVYGGGDAPGNMMKLIKAALRGFPMPFKRVTNSRDFVHVKNLILALNSIIDNRLSSVVLPTDRDPVSTERIIEIIKDCTEKKVRLVKVPKVIITLLKKIKPDLYSKVFGSLNVECNIPESVYNPTYKLKDGIKEMIN